MTRTIASFIAAILLSGCASLNNVSDGTLMDELRPVLVDLNLPKHPTIHAIFDSVQEQANSQLPDTRHISIVVELPRVEPPPKPDDEIPSIGDGYLRRVSVPDAVRYLTEMADLDYAVLENTRRIVIRKRIHRDSPPHL